MKIAAKRVDSVTRAPLNSFDYLNVELWTMRLSYRMNLAPGLSLFTLFQYNTPA